mmetsp:Transcript_24172/g.48518  ORF Transcript_24172/g.48518 Transcript_24172/m.48518 type:complete len:1306 (-) Transcript_24172:121-4038(-)
MPKETQIPPNKMYHHPTASAHHSTSRRGGRHAPPPPSSAAARAAAAAKELHRKAQERAAANSANAPGCGPVNERHGRSRHPPSHGPSQYSHPELRPPHQYQQQARTHPQHGEEDGTRKHSRSDWDSNNKFHDEYDEGNDASHGSRYDGRDHKRKSSSASVFRRSPSDNTDGRPGGSGASVDRDGREPGSENGSILKRLTTGNNRRFRIGPSTEHHLKPPEHLPQQQPPHYPHQQDHKQHPQYYGESERERYERDWYERQSRAEKPERDVHSEAESTRSEHVPNSESSKYQFDQPPPHSYSYPYPYPGMPHGAYPMPPGPYGRPPPPNEMHPGTSYPPPSNAVRTPPRPEKSSSGANQTPTIHTSRDDDRDEGSSKASQPSQQQQYNPYYPQHPHEPYPPPPGYYDGHPYYDPNYYPYGHPPPHYHHGYYPPPPGGQANIPEHTESNDNRDRATPVSHSRDSRPTSQSMPQLHSNMPPPQSNPSKSSSVHDDGHTAPSQNPPPRTTRRIIGSASPIHIPRYSEPIHESSVSTSRKESAPPAQKKQGGPGSVFRSSSKEVPRGYDDGRSSSNRDNDSVKKKKFGEVMDETSAHEILLSLSKSYDHGDAENRVRTRSSRNRATAKSDDATPGAVADGEERPKSPDEPPRIQHFHKRQNSESFEPQPSPQKESQTNDVDAAIDLAPSFTLFNQSFDMNLESVIGPNASFGLGPMKSLSFGLGLSGSIDYGDNLRASPLSASYRHRPPTRELRDSASDNEESLKLPTLDTKESRGNLQVLRASPSNSFGNVVRATSGEKEGNRGSSIMVLGDSVRVSTPPHMSGQKRDRSPSPSPDFTGSKKCNTLDASNNEGKSKTMVLDNSARQLPFRTKFSEKAPGSGKREKSKSSKSGHKRERPTVDSSLFRVLERHSDVFDSFAFLVPGAKAFLKAAKTNSEVCKEDVQLTQREKDIARRRVNSALFAFGGDSVRDSSKPDEKKSIAREKYEKLLTDRYYEDENRLSWEVEEDPPVEISEEEDDYVSCNTPQSKRSDSISSKTSDPRRDGKSEVETKQKNKSNTSVLQRSIGIMVYPAVNAFTATEPGIITPALNEMNNFVENSKSPESTPAKGLTNAPPQNNSSSKRDAALPMVSPDSVRLVAQGTPSTCEPENRTPQRWTPGSNTKNSSVNYAGGAWMCKQLSPEQKLSPEKPRGDPSTDLLFVDTLDLRPEQYRAVTERNSNSKKLLYSYPSLPLPYGQRKRISNAMFAMSQSIPGLTDECAKMLSEARRRDAWDFAVAQLMTQVIVITHCSVEDNSLDGLSKYLLTLGISC